MEAFAAVTAATIAAVLAFTVHALASKAIAIIFFIISPLGYLRPSSIPRILARLLSDLVRLRTLLQVILHRWAYTLDKPPPDFSKFYTSSYYHQSRARVSASSHA